MAYLDATGEALAGLLRPGNAGSGTATDHVTVLTEALAQLPVDPTNSEVIVRAASAGWSHGFVEACRERDVRFVIGHQLTGDLAKVLVDLPKRAWQSAISADGTDWRDHGEVAEITHLVNDVFDTTRPWPEGLRLIARREQPHPGAQLTFTATNCSPPTWPTPTSATSKRSTADAAAPKDKSATPKPPASPTCPRTHSRSTMPGSNSCSAPTTSSHGPAP